MNLGLGDRNRRSADYVREFQLHIDVQVWRRCRLIDGLAVVVRTNRLRDDDDPSCRGSAADLLQQSLQLAGSGLPTLAGGSDARKFLERIVLRNRVVINSLWFFVACDRSGVARWRVRKQERQHQNSHEVQQQREAKRSTRESKWRYRSVLKQIDRFSPGVQAHPSEHRFQRTPPVR